MQVSEMYKSDEVVRVSEGFGTSSETDVDQRTGGKDFDWLNWCHAPDQKSAHVCSKVNGNPGSVGALQYALHLRFLCPSPRKCSRSVEKGKSKFLSQPGSNIDNEERKIYLYNDLRVGFPQHHSDADEGKLDFISLQLSIGSFNRLTPARNYHRVRAKMAKSEWNLILALSN
ncbi:hypothetical protein ACET3Z_015007 [Daucus carota]